jgi:hypothetical protein
MTIGERLRRSQQSSNGWSLNYFFLVAIEAIGTTKDQNAVPLVWMVR